MPILALLLFGGATLKDFAFALLIGVASGAYSSIFIASPVLTHWKEREPVYRARRRRIEEQLGYVPAYAAAGGDVEPPRKRGLRRPGRVTQPDPETVSAAEFEEMKRSIQEEEREPSRHTSTLTKRLARTDEDTASARPDPSRSGRRTAKPAPAPPAAQRPAAKTKAAPAPPAARPAAKTKPSPPPSPAPAPPEPQGAPGEDGGDGDGFQRAPDIAENEGVAPVQKPNRPAKGRSRNRRHGRRR